MTENKTASVAPAAVSYVYETYEFRNVGGKRKSVVVKIDVTALREAAKREAQLFDEKKRLIAARRESRRLSDHAQTTLGETFDRVL